MAVYIIGAVVGTSLIMLGVIAAFAAILIPRFPDEPRLRGIAPEEGGGSNGWTVLDRFAVWLIEMFKKLIGQSKKRTKTMILGLVLFVLGAALLALSIWKISDQAEENADTPPASASTVFSSTS